MSGRRPRIPPLSPGARLTGRAFRYLAVAALLALAWWLGAGTAGSFISADCYSRGGIWSEIHQVCECANYGGRRNGPQCIRPGR